ncbi:sugar ABC transporter ATP-binding protein [Clostridium butyricum]|uniref:Ribose/galactose/methyl galactoside import ATP-binding protein n=1 Tax=Clostridium butyricum E4 str. BoNT E BL5262 TaxID=632245 RepID=C4IM88_CLOBU|nr:sugar ABC transporter ATP-binding protein [Clostridium butyricum]APF24117.1 ABC transporter family protein [Clostridium butyricum]EDT74593.1 ribose import ATP-binding protein RbsA [Clostridium butyricum 5521]EEP52757.1 galactose/methyl galactoside import ATP-binding protein MglA [Clostridium butyricum E4 str. BoNT E BL5262]MCQ2012209.1 sugar ABC transporter ATP-binding protein [Clostridium butyricum]MCQ2016599.1 sugar ABC transporter ATP-binding protein [Clostridium butyricum]
MSDEYILEMNNIIKVFPGVKALDDVTLKVRPGSVHALMGENGAGKSTLMKCLFGVYQEDGGEIIFDGKKRIINSSKQALDLGISMIHQELHPIRYRPVMENIWLGRFPMKGIAVDKKTMIKKTKELFQEVDLDINPEILAGDLSASNLQLVEIAKAVSYDSKIIIMDEPTSSLTVNETEHLFKIIKQLQNKGCAIIYISHKMEEILKISDEVTIMRDGQYVGTWKAQELTTDLIINRMVGRDMTNRFPDKDYETSKEEILKVSNFCSTNPKSFQNINFELYKGEILGIGGLVGAQRTELVEAIFGLHSIECGTIEKEGKEIKIKCVKDAKQQGFALLTEERRATGIFGILSVLDNTVIANQKNYSKFGVLNDSSRYEVAKKSNTDLRTKTPGLEEKIENLSGGNQQKVLIARWLLTNPDILILDEPTRGIDVGAKYEIYTIIRELARKGKAIIMISSEMPELIGMSDRIMVMCEGRVTAILNHDEADQVKIMNYSTQFMK